MVGRKHASNVTKQVPAWTPQFSYLGTERVLRLGSRNRPVRLRQRFLPAPAWAGSHPGLAERSQATATPLHALAHESPEATAQLCPLHCPCVCVPYRGLASPLSEGPSPPPRPESMGQEPSCPWVPQCVPGRDSWGQHPCAPARIACVCPSPCTHPDHPTPSKPS